MKERTGGPIVLAAAFVAMSGAIGVQAAKDARHPLDERRVEQILYVRSGTVLKRLALGFNSLAADTYWIRTLQHYGGERRMDPSQRKYELLYPLLDITTSLDPYFTIAYRFGAIFLAEQFPGGPGRPDLAIALLGKGIAAQPTKWQYYLDTGFVYYWHLRDFKAAAGWFQRASEQPNSPNWLRPLAGTMLVKGGDRASARFLWQQLLLADQPWLRRLAERRLGQIDSLDQIERLEAIVQRSASTGGGYSWAGLIQRRILPGVPLDPAGTPYDLDPVTGAVTIAPQSELFPLPDDIRPTVKPTLK